MSLSNPQAEIYNSRKPRNLFLAGVGSGKSYIAAPIALRYVTSFPQLIGFIGANTYSQLAKSTLKRIFEVWASYNMQEGVHYVVDKIPPDSWMKYHPKLKTYDNTITFDNGALIFTASLDNYKVIDGTEFAWAILDETKDTREEAVKEVIVARLRQRGLYTKEPTGELTYSEEKHVEGLSSFNPLYIMTSPAKVPWLNEWFTLDKNYASIKERIFSRNDYYKLQTDRLCVVVSSTYHNERNLPEGYIDNLLSDYAGSPHLIDMLVYGSPIAKSGGEFYQAFDRINSVVENVELNGDLPIHVSFDFNVKPYIYASIFQLEYHPDTQTFEVRGVKEYPLTSPRNNTEDLCDAILRDHGNHRGGWFLYGDASGVNRSTLSRNNRHNYDVILEKFQGRIHGTSYRVPKKNPPLIARRDFINKVFAGGTSIRFKVSESMGKLIADLEYVQEDPTGGKLKTLSKDPVTGEKYEKYGHASDAMDYFWTEAFRSMFQKRA